MTKADQLVAQFREEMSKLNSRCLIVFSDRDSITNEAVVKVTSNSTRRGVQMILASLLQPTKRAIEVLARELGLSAAAGAGMSKEDATQLALLPEFVRGAHALFEELRPHYTITGWDDEDLAPAPAADASKTDSNV
jgi:hypothetical protein